MIRLEQVRGEMLERFERVDRRFALNEQRLARIEQRLAELIERIDALREEPGRQLELPPVSVVAVGADLMDAKPPGLAVRFEVPVEEVRRDPQGSERVPRESEQVAVARSS
jgi:hypothetical protein